MVAFLSKPQGSEGFHQIVDFLNASHIRYALTETSTIYVSLINQFWCTASVGTLDNGEIELITTVDGHEKSITEASVRNLKLADADGISTLPTTEIFKQLAFGAERLFNLPNEPPVGEGNTSRSGEGSMQLLELMEICTKLSDKATTLEDEFRSTKEVYNKSSYLLSLKSKRIDNKLKLKRRSTIVNSSEDEEASLDIEDPSKQGRMIEEIDQDENVNLVKSIGGLSTNGVDEELAKKLFEEEQARFNAEQEARFKVEQEQERIDFETTLELQKQLDEREENRSFSVAEVRKNMCMYLKNQEGYKLSHFKGMKYEEIRPIFERDEKEKKKDEESSKQVEEETVQKEDVIPEQVVKESSRKAEEMKEGFKT
ncbi:hypothetical protein Tco_0841472 [Tanacetum coccineum]|uniref:Uncharacterized protein n=1 Tax=Tanacetum coccineum TaxID=301880 RepID=A0ABQ5AWG3_9ASTR